jgi:hypothetical protein
MVNRLQQAGERASRGKRERPPQAELQRILPIPVYRPVLVAAVAASIVHSQPNAPTRNLLLIQAERHASLGLLRAALGGTLERID